jgi:predicted nucleic acid-binding protein
VIVYCDTSFLVSYLHTGDANHLASKKMAAKWTSHEFVVCEVHLLEFPAAVRAATHRLVDPLPERIAHLLNNRFDRAVNSRLFLRKDLDMSDSVSMARSLGDVHGWKKRHTAFGLWHLAAAWSLSAGVFLTFDKRQAEIVRTLGIAVG